MTNEAARLANSQQPTANSQPDLYPLISIIVPVYKVEQYLDRCIASIVNQTYRNLEIILIDDGSPDNSPAICDEWANKDTRIKVIHKENGGQSSARNRGLDIASGKYIGFVDSDDYILPEMYQTLYGLVSQYDADMSMLGIDPHTETEVVEGREILEKLIVPEKQKKQWLNFGSMFDRLCKAEIFRELRFTEGIIHEDVAIMHRILGACQKAVFFYGKSLPYIYTPNRLGSTMTSIREQNIHAEHLKDVPTFYGTKYAYDDRYEYLKSMGMDDLAKISYLRFSVYSLHLSILNKVKYLQYRKRIREFTGMTTFQAVIKLLFAWNLQIKLRGVKLGIALFKNVFRRLNKE